ncbi:MAG TPA: hypothetical protein DCP92_10290 [Nitrospiraceae bacterium]|jgi:DUF438 domain-containing protein|nr:hypothetical protein [Nitrospiraceae bacterium]
MLTHLPLDLSFVDENDEGLLFPEKGEDLSEKSWHHREKVQKCQPLRSFTWCRGSSMSSGRQEGRRRFLYPDKGQVPPY